MGTERKSKPDSSAGTRWSLDSIELEQPSLRLIAPDSEDPEGTPHVAEATSAFEHSSIDVGTQSLRDVDDVAEPKTEADAKTTELPPPTQPRANIRSILLDWWEELLSVTTAVVCTALSIAILAYMNGRSLSDWKLRLQPNTLIALLATITRAALIYPLGECLGYLKWKYFERPRTLAHIQTFDAASRGPLGAIQYLWTLPHRSPLATCAALLTTLLLLFQPFAQQTISFASRVAPLANETAHAFRAIGWNTTRPGSSSAFAEPFFPALSYKLYKAISEEAAESSDSGHCSTSLCQYPEFDTLAVCSECEQHNFDAPVDSLFGDCVWQNMSSAEKNLSNYTVFGLDPFMRNQTDAWRTNRTTMNNIIHEISKRLCQETFELRLSCGLVYFSSDDHRSTIYLDILSSTFDYTYLTIKPFDSSYHRIDPHDQIPGKHIFFYNNLTNAFVPPEDPHKGEVNYWHHYTETGSLRGILNSTFLNLTNDLRLWFTENAASNQFGVINGTETKCSLFPCIQRATGAKQQNTELTAQYINTGIRRYGGIFDDAFCSGHDSKCIYFWTPDSLKSLGSWINSTIGTQHFKDIYFTQTNSPGDNYTLFYQRVAAQVSAMLQSQSNPDTLNITGTAYGMEIYVQVNWMWFTLPLVLLASCLLIVVLCIWDSSKKGYLFKNNVLAAIAFELHGWEPHEYGVDETWTRYSMRNVEKKAERMVARMQLPKDGDGSLRLKKE